MKNLLKDNKSFLVRFCVHCDKSLLKISVTCKVVSNKQGYLQLSILTVVLLCLQAYQRMSMNLKEAHHARCHHVFMIIPLCTHLKESTVSALTSHLCFIDEYCVKEDFSAEDTKQLTLTLMDASYCHWMVFFILDGLINMCAFCFVKIFE